MVLRPLLFFFLFLLPTAANAQLAIDRLWVDMDDGRAGRADLVVRNESPDVYYVTVTASEIVAPGTAEEERKVLTDPEALGLLVTPNRLVLRPDEMRAIRVVSLNRDLATDRVYRVNVTPQIGELSLADESAENRGIALKLLAAFDVLVTVRPEDSASSLSAQRLGNTMRLSNAGNTNLLLLQGSVCPASGAALSDETRAHYLAQLPVAEESVAEEAAQDGPAQLAIDEDGCTKIPGRRMYPGNTWDIVAAAGEYVRFQSRRSASENFRELIVRCESASPNEPNSDFCRSARVEADAGAATILP